MGVYRQMRKVGRVCFDCRKVYYTDGTRCGSCESKRTRQRPWYRTSQYRAMQQAARAMWGKTCPRCGETMTGKRRPSVDHVTPISQGGSWYGPFEIVCLICNLSKGGRNA